MGYIDMSPTNQKDEQTVDYTQKEIAFSFPRGVLCHEQPTREKSIGVVHSLWSSDGLMKSNRHFERPSSTPPVHLDKLQPTNTTPSFALSRFSFRETVEENNQEEEGMEQSRSATVGKNLQRSWSAPPIPDNIDPFFSHSSQRNAHHRSLLDLGATDELSSSVDFNLSGHSGWNDCDQIHSFEKTSTTTISPIASPLTTGRSDVSFEINREFLQRKTVRKSVPLSLVDRVQGDFPRTPSPVFGTSAQDFHIPQGELNTAMNRMTLDDTKHPYSDRRAVSFVANRPSYMANYPITTPPGFAPPTIRGIYGSGPRPHYTSVDEHPQVNHGYYPVLPVDYNQMYPPPRGPYPPNYPPKCYEPEWYPPQPQVSLPRSYAPRPNPHYDCPLPMYRSKQPGQHRRADLSHAHSYSTSSLLEEFKAAGKAEKWDLETISGHLVQFAREQNGSRFIQQKLEKADEATRNAAFQEIFPDALVLMMDVFGNYVIQKFFDHGSVEQQERLVTQMQKHMITLALQVYGCRVIQKALEVSPVELKLLLIRELHGHVMTCVMDQNGNHVLQKCIEAASWHKTSQQSHGHVTAGDIQFIVDDFIGKVTVLSTHSYGCRVIQRVLEHCSPRQIRPIVAEIIVECRELVKDQYGNYVVQHVIIYAERDQRDIVMQVIVPEIAKWSQHKYASNVVEACLEHATAQEICQIVDFILACDESGTSCALLPMMKHMYGNYVVQKLLDKTNTMYRQRIVNIIMHNADYLKRFTYGKHVLSRLERENNVRFH